MAVEWKQYRHMKVVEMIPWDRDGYVGDHLIAITRSQHKAGSPKAGDMVARDRDNHADTYIVTAEEFARDYVPKD